MTWIKIKQLDNQETRTVLTIRFATHNQNKNLKNYYLEKCFIYLSSSST